MVIAQCNDCTLQSLHNAVTRTPHPLAAPPAGDQTLQRTTQRLRLAPPTSRQANKSKNQQIDKLASWRAHHQHRAGCARHLQGLTIYPCRPCRAPPPRTHVAPTSISHNTKEPASQETDKSRSRKAGKLESWKVGKLASVPPRIYRLPPPTVGNGDSTIQSQHSAITAQCRHTTRRSPLEQDPKLLCSWPRISPMHRRGRVGKKGREPPKNNLQGSLLELALIPAKVRGAHRPSL